jgi:hypothetical protein
MFERRLLQAMPGSDPQFLEKSAALAADAFLPLYGAEPKKTAKAKKR